MYSIALGLLASRHPIITTFYLNYMAIVEFDFLMGMLTILGFGLAYSEGQYA